MNGKIPFSILLTAFAFPFASYAAEQPPDHKELIQSQRLPAVTAGETPPLAEIVTTEQGR